MRRLHSSSTSWDMKGLAHLSFTSDHPQLPLRLEVSPSSSGKWKAEMCCSWLVVRSDVVRENSAPYTHISWATRNSHREAESIKESPALIPTYLLAILNNLKWENKWNFLGKQGQKMNLSQFNLKSISIERDQFFPGHPHGWRGQTSSQSFHHLRRLSAQGTCYSCVPGAHPCKAGIFMISYKHRLWSLKSFHSLRITRAHQGLQVLRI